MNTLACKYNSLVIALSFYPFTKALSLNFKTDHLGVHHRGQGHLSLCFANLLWVLLVAHHRVL